MHEILEYLRGLSQPEREDFAERCGTSVGYLRKAVSAKQQLGIDLCLSLDRESGGVLRCERLFPDLDWEYLRKTVVRQAPAAINSEAKEGAHA